jgi:Protein of unknown function (DUF2829)
MNFGEALEALKGGGRVTRAGWNGAGQWLILVPGSTITVAADRPLGKAAPRLIGQQVQYAPHIDIHTVQGALVPWLASQADMLAEDWKAAD